MSFAGKVWRLLVGIKDALALLFLLLFFMAFFAILSARPNPGLVRDGALLLKLDGMVVEEVAPIDPLAALFAQSLPIREYAARDLVHAIDEAATDKRVKAIALDLSRFLGGGRVHLEEVTEALDRFRRTEKPILAYAVAYTDDSLMLAAHASEVWVDPMGGAAISGPGGERLYFKNALDRFDINMHIYRVGDYKAAVEPYMQSGMSPEARDNIETIYASLWEEWQANVGTARPDADIDAMASDPVGLLEAAGGDLAKAAVSAGVADRIGTHEQWGKRVAQIVGEDDWDDTPGAFASTDLKTWLADIGPASGPRGLTGRGKAIGVITIAGEISDGHAGPGSAGAARIEALLDDALDKNLKALVVRVDSPGGTVTGSEVIRRAILRHKANNIPIIASFGNYAASGGYWLATSADRIFAEPETVTGSIGVFLVFPSFENLLAKYGVTSDGVRTTPLSGQPDLLAGLTPETERILQAETEAIYSRFLGLVAASRGITRDRANELGQGRVYTGGSARQLGLVDQFGDLDAALAAAAQAAQLEEGDWYPLFLGEESDSLTPLIVELLGGDDDAQETAAPTLSTLVARRERARLESFLADLESLLDVTGVQARCLECAHLSAPALAAPEPEKGTVTRLLRMLVAK